MAQPASSPYVHVPRETGRPCPKCNGTETVQEAYGGCLRDTFRCFGCRSVFGVATPAGAGPAAEPDAPIQTKEQVRARIAAAKANVAEERAARRREKETPPAPSAEADAVCPGCQAAVPFDDLVDGPDGFRCPACAGRKP